MTVRADCVVSAWSSLPLQIKTFAHWLSLGGESAFGQESTLSPSPSPPPRLPASKIKQTFLSTYLVSLLAFEWPAAGPTLVTS